jgi:hypothetical protein
MIHIQAAGFPQFLAAFGLLRAAGVQMTASGGNAMSVPDDTDLAVLRAVAATGAVVHADLDTPSERAATPTTETSSADGDTNTRKPRKTATRRKTTRE